MKKYLIITYVLSICLLGFATWGHKLAQFKSSVEIQSQLLAKYCTYTI